LPRPFRVVDCETDPFESADEAVQRRSCPECAAVAGSPCVDKTKKLTVHEQRRRVPQPFIWGLYGGGANNDDYLEFDTKEELIAYLQPRKEVVYAHNGGKFDYHYLRDDINTGEVISIIAGRLAKFRIGECEFRDSMNILPVPLATFKKDKIDYSIMEPGERDKPANRDSIRTYLRGDCQYLHELISAHRAENGIALTQAGASMRAWSKQSKISPPRQSGPLYQYYKPYYYGGRVQCFEQGIARRDFKLIDMNSAYPEAMLHAHPFSTKGDVEAHLPPDGEIHKCLITLTCVARGCFPFRLGDDPTKGELFFPYDERTVRRYHVTGYEFITALELDAIKPGTITIETVHYFEQSVKFEEFILQNWDRRAKAKAEGNKALDIIVKLLMNSLYGKFASDYAKYSDYLLSHIDEVYKYELEGYQRDANWGADRVLLARSIPESKHRFYNIATAASITGYVRARLFEAISRCSGPIYCDTDSIACVDTGTLVLGDGLGAWKLEGEFDEYAITGKKTYGFHKRGAPYTLDKDEKGRYEHYKIASKGVDLNPHELWTAAAGQEVEYKPMVPTYSVKRPEPIFVNRRVNLTVRDISKVPESA
jgi:hypothetical protein